MTEWKFIAFTQLYGIAGTSYQLRLGRVNDTWTIQLIKDNSILAQQMFSDPSAHRTHKILDEEEYFPSPENLAGWVKISIILPNINEVHIVNTVRALIAEAKKNYDEHKKNRATAGQEERNKVKLAPVKESEIHRPISPGQVVDDQNLNVKKLLDQIELLENENKRLRRSNKTLEEEIRQLREESNEN